VVCAVAVFPSLSNSFVCKPTIYPWVVGRSVMKQCAKFGVPGGQLAEFFTVLRAQGADSVTVPGGFLFALLLCNA
jgi:hypothetical protein